MFKTKTTTALLGILVLSIIAETSLIAAPQRSRSSSSQRGKRQYRSSSRRSGSKSVISFILRDEKLQKDLQISEDQKTKLQELSKKSTLPFDDYFKKLSTAKNEEEKSKIRAERKVQSAALKKQKEAEAFAVLTQSQRDELDKAFVEKGGLGALQAVSIQKKLKLSQEQLKSLGELAKKRGEARRKLGYRSTPEKRAEFEKDWNAKTYQVFTSDQKITWVSLGGKLEDTSKNITVAETKSEEKKSGETNSEEEKAEDETVDKSSEKRTVRVSDKIVGDGTVVASFAPSNKKMKDTTFGKPSTIHENSKQSKRRNRDSFNSFNAAKISFNFANAPWETVLNYFADKTDLTLVTENVPKENFNYRDSHQYTPTEALDILNGYLDTKGFVLLRKHRFLYLHDLEEPIPPNMIPDVTPEGLYFRGKHEYVRVTFRLREGVDVTKMAQQIEDMQGEHGSAVPMTAANALIVVDTAQNLIRIKDLIPIDEPGPNELVFKYYKLRYILAYDAEELVSDQLGLTNGARSVSASTASSGQQSSDDRRKRFREFFSRMRESRGRRGGDSNATKKKVAKTNSTSQKTNSGKEKVSADYRSNGLLVTCTSATMKRVDQIIEEIDKPNSEDELGDLRDKNGKQIYLIPVGRRDPVPLATTLESLFESEAVDARPSIKADAAGRKLIVRSTEAQYRQIEKMITGMEERSGLNGTGMTRFFDLTNRNSGEYLQLLRSFWNRQNPNQPLNFNVVPTNGVIRERVVPSLEDIPNALKIPGYNTLPGRPLQKTSHPMRRPTNPAKIPKRIEKDTAIIDKNSIVQTSFLDDEKKNANRTKNSESQIRPAVPQKEKKKIPITITNINGQLVIQHPDPKVLDEFEKTMNMLLASMPANNGWTVFYLRSCDATTTAELLGKIFQGSTVAETSATTSGSLFGGFFSRLGNQVASATGLEDANNLTILPDVRTNSLLVKGPPVKIAEVRQTLKVLDVSEVPASLKDRFPRSIPVNYADVNQIAENLRELYKDYLEPEGGSSKNANPFAALMGGGRSRRSRGGSGNDQSNQIRLAISVDSRMGDLLVSASDSLFTQIETYVKQRDEAAKVGKYQSRVIQPLYTDPEKLLESVLKVSSKIQGESMVSGSTRSGSNNRSRSSSSSQDARRKMFEQMMRGGFSRGSRSSGRPSFSFRSNGRTSSFSRGGSSRGGSRGSFSRSRSRSGRGR